MLGLTGASIALLIGAAVASASGVTPRSLTDEERLQEIYVSVMRGGSGGTYGYYVKPVGGPVVLSLNERHVFDPASAFKTLHLAYSMRQVAGGADSLSGPVTVFAYPNSRNAGGNPSSPNLCPNPVDEVPANAVTHELEVVLRGMMTVSDNRHTRAVELRYGRDNLNAFASALGMSSTRLDQILGCGFDNGRRNTWTLEDAGRLYEAISTGSGVPASVRDRLYGLMIGVGPGAGPHESVVREEAASLGIGDAAAPFGAGIVGRLKGGSYDICTGSCAQEDLITRDLAGVITIPFRSPSGVALRDFVFGSFIEGLRIGCPNASCEAGTRARAAIEASIGEMLRSTIRTALRSWAAVTRLTAAPAATTRGRLRVRASLRTVYGAKRPAGMLIRFTAGRRPLCRARTNDSGVAVCLAKSRGEIRRYAASFAGGRGLFPARASARVRGER